MYSQCSGNAFLEVIIQNIPLFSLKPLEVA